MTSTWNIYTLWFIGKVNRTFTIDENLRVAFTSMVQLGIGHSVRWDVITHPCSNWNGGLAKPPKVRHEWVSISHCFVDVVTHPCRKTDRSLSNLFLIYKGCQIYFKLVECNGVSELVVCDLSHLGLILVIFTQSVYHSRCWNSCRLIWIQVRN